MANGTETPTAPYLPWPSFTGFARDLKGTVVPPRIDRSIMKHMSGGGQSALRTALRFFGLVTGEDHKVTQAFRDLVAAHDTDKWKPTVTALLGCYVNILEGVDIKTATPQILEEAFRDRGNVEGSALRKALRFYVAMAEESGEELSPLLQGRRKSSGEGRRAAPRARSKANKGTNGAEGGEGASKLPAGVTVLRPLPDREFKVWLPDDMTDAEIKFAMKYVTDFLGLRKKPQ